MYKVIILASIVALSCAHIIPLSYHVVSYHPTEWKKSEEWKEPEVKVEEVTKEPEPKIEEVKAEEWKAPVEVKAVEWKEPETPANYDFKYEVHDEKTGDIKSQQETAVNGAVKGQYSLIDSDGYKRIVEYTADDVHGFQATVKREPTHYKIPEPVKVVEVIPHGHWW